MAKSPWRRNDFIYINRKRRNGEEGGSPTPPIPTTYRTWPINKVSQGYSLTDYNLYLLYKKYSGEFVYTIDYEGAPSVEFSEFTDPHTAVEMNFVNIKSYLDNYGGFSAWPNFVNRGIRTGIGSSNPRRPVSVYVMYADNGVYTFERWYNGSQGSDFDLYIQKTNSATVINNKATGFVYYELFANNTTTTIADKSHFQDLITNYITGDILFTSLNWNDHEDTIRGLFREHLVTPDAMTIPLNEMILQ